MCESETEWEREGLVSALIKAARTSRAMQIKLFPRAHTHTRKYANKMILRYNFKRFFAIFLCYLKFIADESVKAKHMNKINMNKIDIYILSRFSRD